MTRAYDAVLAQWPVPYETMDLPSRFGTTRVLAAGPPDGEPLILLHGGGATSAVWFADIMALSADRRVFAVDHICDAGRSVAVRGSVRTREDIVAWLESVLDGLALVRADVAGHSYGGWTALVFALGSRRVRRLALIDPSKCFAGFKPGYLLHALPMMLLGGETRRRRFMAWETGGRPLDPAWLTLVATGAQGDNGAKVVMPKRPSDEELRGLDVPVLLFLAGQTRSHDIRKIEEQARRLLPDVTVVLLPDATHHTLPQQHAAELDPVLLDFLRSRPAE